MQTQLALEGAATDIRVNCSAGAHGGHPHDRRLPVAARSAGAAAWLEYGARHAGGAVPGRAHAHHPVAPVLVIYEAAHITPDPWGAPGLTPITPEARWRRWTRGCASVPAEKACRKKRRRTGRQRCRALAARRRTPGTRRRGVFVPGRKWPACDTSATPARRGQDNMDSLSDRVAALSPDRLRGIRRGIEKESLRAQPDGQLALTRTRRRCWLGADAPAHHHRLQRIAAGADHRRARQRRGLLAELTEIHQFVIRAGGARRRDAVGRQHALRAADRRDHPHRRYGIGNVGRAKSVVYRMGLGHRYGRRMQTISGIHYNWSPPGLSNDRYFALIRNFRRHAFLLLYLFGASPAVCPASWPAPARTAAAGRHAATCRMPRRCAWGGWLPERRPGSLACQLQRPGRVTQPRCTRR